MHKAGTWHLSLTLECEEIERLSGNAACGFDWGVETFIMLAHRDGSSEPIENPRFHQAPKDREHELERIRDRRQRGSRRRDKAVVRCARLKAKNARRRLDFHHQESARLITRFALIGSDEIGRGIVATLDGHRSPAVLMSRHGVFTIGDTARNAVKAAVMCEDVARTVHLARAYGELEPLEPDQVDALHKRYTEQYGQR